MCASRRAGCNPLVDAAPRSTGRLRCSAFLERAELGLDVLPLLFGELLVLHRDDISLASRSPGTGRCGDIATADLWSVVVGGLIGIVGTLIGPPTLHFLQRGEQRRQVRITKFEELISTLYEQDVWLDTLREYYVLGSVEKYGAAPIAKAYAIAITYLPEVIKIVEELDSACNQHRTWMIDKGQERVRTGQIDINDYGESYSPYQRAFTKALDELREFAEENLRHNARPFARFRLARRPK